MGVVLDAMLVEVLVLGRLDTTETIVGVQYIYMMAGEVRGDTVSNTPPVCAASRLVNLQEHYILGRCLLC